MTNVSGDVVGWVMRAIVGYVLLALLLILTLCAGLWVPVGLIGVAASSAVSPDAREALHDYFDALFVWGPVCFVMLLWCCFFGAAWFGLFSPDRARK